MELYSVFNGELDVSVRYDKEYPGELNVVVSINRGKTLSIWFAEEDVSGFGVLLLI